MNGFDVYEVKYLRNPLDFQTMKQEEKQIRNIKGIDINNIGFIPSVVLKIRPAIISILMEKSSIKFTNT